MLPLADENLPNRGLACVSVNGLGRIAVTEQTGGVAHMAHIGGFVTGLAVGSAARLLLRR